LRKLSDMEIKILLKLTDMELSIIKKSLNEYNSKLLHENDYELNEEKNKISEMLKKLSFDNQ